MSKIFNQLIFQEDMRDQWSANSLVSKVVCVLAWGIYAFAAIMAMFAVAAMILAH